VGVRRDGKGWRCHQCDAGGDAADLAGWVRGGGRLRDLSDSRKAAVRAWAENFTPGPISWQPSTASAPAMLATEYPPAAEVAGFWDASVPVPLDAGVAHYLGAVRGIDPELVAQLDLARALPRDATTPAWAGFNSPRGPWPWTASGHRLIVPLFDARGVLRSVLARACTTEARTKSAAPAGYQRRGLVMADDLALRLLEHGKAPDWCEGELGVLIAEGEIDFMRWGLALAGDERAPATLGLVSGGWSQELADRIPDGATVTIATHTDPAGAGYQRRILDTLRKRWETRKVQVEVWIPSTTAS